MRCAISSRSASRPTRCRGASCCSPTTRSRCCRAASSIGPGSRPCSPMLGEALTIPRVMTLRRSADPHVHALVSDGRRITWAELDEASRALAGRLVGSGLGKGDRVGLLMPNGIDWATAALAVMRVGAVLVPLSTLLRPPELLAQLRVASVTHLIAVRAHRGRSYVNDLRSLAPRLVGRVGEMQRDPIVPSPRAIWISVALPDAPV